MEFTKEEIVALLKCLYEHIKNNKLLINDGSTIDELVFKLEYKFRQMTDNG